MPKVAVYFRIGIVAFVTTKKPFMQEEKKHEKVLYRVRLRARDCDVARRMRAGCRRRRT
jgi:hypothetical protein